MNSNTPIQPIAPAIDEHYARSSAVPQIFQGPPTATYEIEPDEASIPLSHYLWILRRHRWNILAFMLICAGASLVVSKRLTPIYEATVTVDVDRRVPTGIIGQDAAQTALNDADQFLATQVKLIQSDSVLRPVADQYELREPEPGTSASELARIREAPVVLKQLKVTRPPNTYLLLISFRSKDAALAANVANGVARSYVEHAFDIRFRSSANLSTFMEKQLDELKAKMERSNAARAQFEKELNVINPTEKTNILSSRLLQLNTDYTAAQTDRVRKETSFRSVSGGTLESAQASTQGEALQKLTERLNEAREKFAQVKTHFGVNHPEYRKAETQVLEIEKQFEDTKQSVMRRVEVEYREAANREAILKTAVAVTKAEFDSLNARSFEYDSLKREAEADTSLYEELVKKIREAGINAGFQSNTVRIADNARPGRKPVFPDIPLNVGLALLFSAIVAVGAAVLSDTLDSTLRDTEQVTRVVKAEVLGGLPLVKTWKNRLPLSAAHGGRIATTTAMVRRPEEDRMLSGFEEAIRTLRNTILLGSFDRRIRSLMVTSATPGEGKSTISVHLATAHAQQNHKTLLIDCDLRRPSLDRKLGMNPESGLATVLLNGLDWRGSVVPVPGVENLSVLLAGPVSRLAADLIGNALPHILQEAASEYDLVILDTPPALGFPEPLQMAATVDAVVLIALAGQTNRKALASVVNTLKRLRANVAGVVLNEVTKDVADSYYYHGYYGKYARYYQREEGAA
jgi:capsular exopolysaccharide synthesis family protein